MGVGNILRICAFNFPKKDAMVFGNQRTTYAELNRRVNCIASSFLKMGLAKGDRIICYYGAIKAGAVAVTISSLSTPLEIEQVLADSVPKGSLKNNFTFYTPMHHILI